MKAFVEDIKTRRSIENAIWKLTDEDVEMGTMIPVRYAGNNGYVSCHLNGDADVCISVFDKDLIELCSVNESLEFDYIVYVLSMALAKVE